ncbi:MAG: RHS repeat-associated core domain-containing protein, partial [Vulcanimicrobiota bacterium]
ERDICRGTAHWAAPYDKHVFPRFSVKEISPEKVGTNFPDAALVYRGEAIRLVPSNLFFMGACLAAIPTASSWARRSRPALSLVPKRRVPGVPPLNAGHSKPSQPTLGRFLVRDPIGYSGGMNLYAYCANNPLNAVDPSGLEELELTEGAKHVFQSGPNAQFSGVIFAYRVTYNTDTGVAKVRVWVNNTSDNYAQLTPCLT